jgi:hypothetical protein
MKPNDVSFFVVSILALELVGCAHKLVSPVDTAPVSQGLVDIDQSFARIQKEKAKKVIDQIASAGRKEVADTKAALTSVEAQALKLTSDRDWAYDQIKVRDGWLDDAKHTIVAKDTIIKKRDAKLDKLGVMLAGAAAGLVFMLLGELVPLLTPAFAAYALVGRLAVSAMVFAAVFGWVRYL